MKVRDLIQRLSLAYSLDDEVYLKDTPSDKSPAKKLDYVRFLTTKIDATNAIELVADNRSPNTKPPLNLKVRER